MKKIFAVQETTYVNEWLGMLPDYREGRGKLALKRIKCFSGMPAEYEKEKMIKAGKEKHTRYMNIKQLSKKI